MDVNESRKILFEEATADEDFRSSFQSNWAIINIVLQHFNYSENTEEMSASKQKKTDKFLSRGMSFQPSAMYNDDDENFEGGDDEEDEEDFEFEPIKKTSKHFFRFLLFF